MEGKNEEVRTEEEYTEETEEQEELDYEDTDDMIELEVTGA